MSFKQRLISLTQREYLPMLGSGVMWGLIFTAVGPADGWRLLAALTIVRSVQLLTRMPTLTALRRRSQAPARVVKKSARRALNIQLGSIAAGILVMAAVLSGVVAAGQPRWAMMIALAAVGYPARNLLQSQPHCNERLFRIVVQWFGAALLVPAHFLDWGVAEVAFIIGLREWVAGLASLIWKRRGRPGTSQSDEPITAAEVAAVTVLRARRAFTYRVSKALLALFMPGAGVLARTGRGLNLHARLDRLLPRYRPGFMVACMGSSAAAAAIVIWLPKPVLLLTASMLFRVGAAAGSVLVWWRYLEHADFHDVDEDED
ncbi:MAG TPA: hypothetical protein VFR36_00700 [Sphingomicrobium sp.]|nr:hypothetical protein [Sphingomicrobium sp.]